MPQANDLSGTGWYPVNQQHRLDGLLDKSLRQFEADLLPLPQHVSRVHRLERGRFVWPQADGGKVHLTAALTGAACMTAISCTVALAAFR